MHIFSKMNAANGAMLLAILAAVFLALNAPFSSLLLQDVTPLMAASFFGFGTAIVMFLITLFGRKTSLVDPKRHLIKGDVKYLILITFFDLLQNILLLTGLSMTEAATAALCQNFDLVATAIIAMLLFKEFVPKRLWIAITLITLGCITVSAGDLETIASSPGLLFILGSCVCLGFANNFQKQVCDRNPSVILTISGLGIGVGALIAALIAGEPLPGINSIILLMILGVLVYGLANFFQYLSQRVLPASKTSTIMAIYPFLASVISLIVYQQAPTLSFFIAILLLVPGFYLATTNKEYQAPPAPVNDVLSQETVFSEKYTYIRNYVTTLGFIIIGATSLLIALGFLNPILSPNDLSVKFLGYNPYSVFVTCGVFLIAIGIIILILRRRDYAAISFMLIGILMLLVSTSTESVRSYLLLLLGGIFIFNAFVLLFSNEKKKYFYFILFVLTGLIFLSINQTTTTFSTWNLTVIILGFLSAGYSFYMAIAASNLSPKCPGKNILTADEELRFTYSGSMVGFSLISLSFAPWIAYYLHNINAHELFFMYSLICGIMLFVLGVLMIFVGKNKFMSAIFLGYSFVTILSTEISGYAFYVLGVILLIFGLFAVLRERSYLLVALMLILNGISAFSSVAITGVAEILFIQILLNVIPCLISIYLILAVFSTKVKFPLF